jgi:hypothetical protein
VLIFNYVIPQAGSLFRKMENLGLEDLLPCGIRLTGGRKKMKLDRITIDPARMNE